MPKYTFRVRREQMLTAEVEAENREAAWATVCGGPACYEVEYLDDFHDQVVECTTPRRGRRAKGDTSND